MENLQKAVEELKNSPTVNIHGKNYSQVSTRINIFRKYFSNASLATEITYNDEFRVIIKAIISIDNQIIATGFAEEVRTTDNSINSTSMIEVCETSAIGRALANFGLGGSEYASAIEVGNAIKQQNNNQNQSTKNINQMQSHNQLTNLGLTIQQQRDMLVITSDNAYEHREIIKQHQFLWNGKNWWKPIEQRAA